MEQGETEAVILVEKDGKYGMYDRQGKVIIAPTLKKVGTFSDGMLAARDREGWTFYDRQGKALASHYDEVGPFSEGLAAVKTDGKWGYIDKQGAYILKPSIGRPSLLKKGMQPSSFRTAGCMLKRWNRPSCWKGKDCQ